jgi:hypothetical protein
MTKVNKVKVIRQKKIVEKTVYPYYIDMHKTNITKHHTPKSLINSFFPPEDEDHEDYSASISIGVTIKPKVIRKIGFSIEALPFCCGISEIGTLRCDENIDINILKELLDVN